MYNIATIVVRIHPGNDQQYSHTNASFEHAELVLFGVDKVPIPGFHFHSGGVEACLEAISGQVILQDLGTRLGKHGSLDTTFVIRQSWSLSDGANKRAGGPLTTPNVPEEKQATGISALLGNLFSPPKSRRRRAKPTPQDIAAFQQRCHQRKIQGVFVGWRLCVHRRNKVKRNVKSIMGTDVQLPDVDVDIAGDDLTKLTREEATSAETGALLQLTPERWESITDASGCVTDPSTFYRSLLHGGCSAELRGTVWKMLLGQHSLHSTAAEREVRDAEVRTSYQALLKECEQVLATEREGQPGAASADGGEKSFGAQCDIIDLDVSRADFIRKNFDSSDPSGEYNGKLRNVLRAVVYQNGDKGYTQGMSDLLEPILVVLDDEASAYYCFNRLLRHVGPRFDNLSEHGIQKSLMKLRYYLAYLDPDLSDHLRALESDHMYAPASPSFCVLPISAHAARRAAVAGLAPRVLRER